MKGVIDRFEDNCKAVILLEDIQEELIVPCDLLPEEAKENDWLTLKKTNDTYQIISIDYERTKAEMKKSRQLREKLRAKSKGSRFKRKN